MLKRCIELYDATHDILITFANTGCEHEETLKFVDAVDRHFADRRVVWIEAQINGPGVGPTARVVDYESASRDGAPMRAAVEKHGVFCKSHPQCTSRLKEEPLLDYRRQCGWMPGTYDTAIGIRADEADRISSKAKEKRFIYPLVREGWRKRDVNEFMSQFEWDLNLPSDAYGNCVWCWKKSLRKLLTVAADDPHYFDLPRELELQFGNVNKGDSVQNESRKFFRNRMSADDVLCMARQGNFTPYADQRDSQPELFSFVDCVVDELDIGEACGESCEVGADG